MKSKNWIALLFIILAIFIAQDIYARAGGSIGGGGYSGGGSYGGGYYGHHHYHYGRPDPYNKVVAGIMLVLTMIFFGVFLLGSTILIRIKNKQSLKTLKKAYNYDSIWDEETIKLHAKTLFHDLQAAWSKNDLKEIEDRVTESFYHHYQNFLARYQKLYLVNIVRDIEIKNIKIVSVVDKLDNTKDAVAVLISGGMVDFLMHQKTGRVLEGDNEISTSFEDVYVFFRKDKTWLLNQIINDPSSGQILKFKNETE